MEATSDYKFIPSFGTSFSTGWRVMADNFLRLFLVVIIMCVIITPVKIFNINIDPSDFHRWNIPDFFTHSSFGIFAAFYGLFALLYGFLVAPVFVYGSDLMFLQAVRRTNPVFDNMIKGFRENYLHLILANLLTFALIGLGFIALIIPGIIIACRLAFVPYLIMDKKIDPIEAVEGSWKLTRGHGWTIFFMGFLSFFIAILGICLLIVGIFPALIWIGSSFATLYESVSKSKEIPTEVSAEAPVI
jgi:uncharacterized membrane protein